VLLVQSFFERSEGYLEVCDWYAPPQFLGMKGMNGKTLMRAMDMGYDTLAKFRASSPERIEAELDAYLRAREERTNRMVPYSSFVRQARKLEDDPRTCIGSSKDLGACISDSGYEDTDATYWTREMRLRERQIVAQCLELERAPVHAMRAALPLMTLPDDSGREG
jgi:hypothetical protein